MNVTVFLGSVPAATSLIPSTIALTEGSKNFSTWVLGRKIVSPAVRGERS